MTIAGCRLGQPVYTYRDIDSTMTAAHQLVAEGASEGALVVAERQTQGRGRQGRSWVSPEGGLYCSFVLRPKRPTAAAQLSLVAGLAAAETIRDGACLYPSVRWPNDLLLQGKKVAGILAEGSRLEAQGKPSAYSLQPRAVILGFGINVTTPADALPEIATSLAASGASACSREDLLAGLCRRLSHWYDLWTDEGFAAIREALRPWMGLFGQPVHIQAGSSRYEGVATDLDEQGRLVVRLDSGIQRAFEAGDVTLLQ